MSARLWLSFISTFVLLSQLQVFGNPLSQSSDDAGKVEKDGFPCYSQADCLSGECCLVTGDDSNQQGVCKKLGTIGSRCSVVADRDQKTVREEYCPCVKELECLASSETCREDVGVLDRFLNIFSPNDDDDKKEFVNDNSVNGDQQPQKKNEEEEEEPEIEEEEAQEQAQEQEQEVEVQQEQENEETETQDEDGEVKTEAGHGFWWS